MNVSMGTSPADDSQPDISTVPNPDIPTLL